MRLAVVILLFFGLCLPAEAAKRVALVIGNSAYINANALPNPRNDAVDIAQKLTELGFDVTQGQDLDLNGMRDTVRNFIKKLDGADLAAFFYAGHGLQVKGANYMVPVDAKLSTEDDVGFEAIAMDAVLVPMERTTRTNLIFLDACRDNPLAKNLARSMGTRSAAVGQGLAQQGGGIGTLIAFSTQPGNVALDGIGRNSPFTSALLKHLGTPSQDIIRDMVFVRRDVIAVTNGAQVPWDNSSLTGEVVLKQGDGSPAVAVPEDDGVETAYWNSVLVDNDPSFFEAYLKRFPKGKFADLARLKIDFAKLNDSANGRPAKNDRKVASLEQDPVAASSQFPFDGRWSLKRSAKNGVCGWPFIFSYVEINSGKIDLVDFRGTVKADGTLNIEHSFGDNITSEKGRNILTGKMTAESASGKFFKPGGGCKGTFTMVRQ